MTLFESENNYIIIERRKLRSGLVFLLAMLFGIGGYFFVKDPASFVAKDVPHTSPMFILVVGIASIIFSLFGLFFAARQFFNNSGGLKIDHEGITIFDSSGNFIAWKDILKFEIHETSHAKMIAVWLATAEKYIGEQKDGLEQKIMQHNYQNSGAAININAGNLKCSIAELSELLTKKLTQYQSGKQPRFA